MKVFVTGATGYIGSAVADALQKHGQEVYGLARSDESASKLAAAGVKPINGDMRDAARVAEAARSSDAVIHAATTNGQDAPEADRSAVEAILSALEGSGKPFLYTSGVWVYGNTGDQVADETWPLNPTLRVTWRPAVEQIVLSGAERGLRSIVIRPAMVYGRGNGMFAEFTRTARENGAARFVGEGGNRWAVVNVDDLAELYVLALEKAPAGSLWLASQGPSFTVTEIAAAASRLAGAGGSTVSWPLDEARKTLGTFADAVVLDQQFTAAKAERELGWKPAPVNSPDDLFAR
jgi:nucleoside-diphosphate-sugar epimerase